MSLILVLWGGGMQLKGLRKEVAELLRSNRQESARIRVENIIREQLLLQVCATAVGTRERAPPFHNYDLKNTALAQLQQHNTIATTQHNTITTTQQNCNNIPAKARGELEGVLLPISLLRCSRFMKNPDLTHSMVLAS